MPTRQPTKVLFAGLTGLVLSLVTSTSAQLSFSASVSTTSQNPSANSGNLDSGLGWACTKPLGPGRAHGDEPFWMEKIKHQGKAAFNPDPEGYQVFRNVKDFGAKGDGITDDTEAINAAISSGNRCGIGCDSSTNTPAIAYFPTGTYLISSPVIALYYTQIIGDARRPPTLLGSSNFSGFALIDADPYIPGGNGAQYYINQNNFFRSIRNFVIDTRLIPAIDPSSNATQVPTGIHWQVSQATSLMNIRFEMKDEKEKKGNNSTERGIFMENGSGGYMGDLVFAGGNIGMQVGNQQFTVRNVTFHDTKTAVVGAWNWGWTFQGVNIDNAEVGFELTTGGLTGATQTVGAEAIIDASITDTPIFIRNSAPSNCSLAGSLVLNNIHLSNVPVAVTVLNGTTVLPGTFSPYVPKHISSWGQGNIYHGTDKEPTFTQWYINDPYKPEMLLDGGGSGRVFGKTHPQYGSYEVGEFVSVKSEGAKGDGKSDDTEVLNKILAKYAGCKIIFFDAGTYIVTSTVHIPTGSRIVGEAWSVISGSGSYFGDKENPKAVIQVGENGSKGVVEITDMIFNTVGPAPGAIVVEWNVGEVKGMKGSAGMWDTHVRLGGADGTDLQQSQCPILNGTNVPECYAAFLALHLTKGSSAYLEGTWVWLADHDLDGKNQTSLYSGRGILSESEGPVWMIGTGSEHHVLYQYNLVNAKNHFMGLIQTESPYYQPLPAPPAPFSIDPKYQDPHFPKGQLASWAVNIKESKDIIIFGAGLYSFFQNYNQTCLNTFDCQSQIINIDSSSASSVSVFSLSTVGTTWMLSVDEEGVADQGDNRNGFASTLTAWSWGGVEIDLHLK